jgi:hypothetical protein
VICWHYGRRGLRGHAVRLLSAGDDDGRGAVSPWSLAHDGRQRDVHQGRGDLQRAIHRRRAVGCGGVGSGGSDDGGDGGAAERHGR